jgi:signal transduction histidine kinase
VAVLTAALAALVRIALSRALGEQISILIYIPAIAFSAWYGGLLPGLVTTGLSVAAHVAFSSSFPRVAPVDLRAEEIRIALLAGTGALISALYGTLRRVRHRLEERFERAQLMIEAGQRLSGTLDSEEIYAGLRDLLSQAIPFDGMIVSSYNRESQLSRCVYGWVNGRPFDHTMLPPITIDLGGPGMQTEVIRSGRARLYANVRARVRRKGGRYYDVGPGGSVRDLSSPEAEPPGSRCALMVPLKLENKVVGIVQLSSDTPGAYKRAHLAMLEAIVAPIAVALQNAELYGRAKREIAERLRIERALTLSEERLKEADQRKDEFLATLAHELRNPLAPIRNAVALLRSGNRDGVKITWAGEIVERQVGHMARLLDDLLDVSRISRGTLRLRPEPVDLADVVRHAAEACMPLIEAGLHPLTMTPPAEPIVLEADPTRLAQVVSNLLNNAARYSESGSPIEVTLRREDGEAVVRVEDRGFGIPESMLTRVFEPFLQIDRSLERSQGGLGIGLTLVKQIVETHGGKVEAKSEGPGKGSVFTVRLPLPAVAPAPLRPAAPVAADEAHAPRRRILVADDLEDSAESLAMLLSQQGHEVRTAHDGDEAVGVARSFLPDVVLLDIAMPKLNGYEAARRILEERGGNRPVLIALTGWGHDENRQRTKEAGFDHHLVKPVEPEALSRLLATVEP